MSMAANKMITDALERRIRDSITVSAMEIVMESLNDILTQYEITPVVFEDTGEDVLLDAYLDAMTVEGRSEKTLYQYRYGLKRFLRSASVTTRNVTQYHIRKYLSDEKARGIKDSTLRGYSWKLSAYFGWLHRDGLIPRNPMGNIGAIKVAKKEQDIFSEVEIEKLKTGCTTLRDKAIVMFFKSTGCRVSEVCRLNRDDIDFQEMQCIVFGKGAKERIVYFDAVTGMVLDEYLKTRKDDNPALFIGLRGERFTPGGIQCMMRKLGKITGVPKVHPHKFRHTELTELVSRGMSIEQVKVIAGHEKIDTTMHYVKVVREDVKNSYRKYA